MSTRKPRGRIGRIFLLLAAVAMIVAVLPLAAAAAHTEGAPFSVNLLADGRADDGTPPIDVGDVEVWNDAHYLYVDYKITEADWCLTKTALDVQLNSGDIPQTKKNNPIPGKFEYSAVHDCVSEYGYMIPMTWDAGDPLFIAAHANVVKGSAIGEHWAQNVLGFDQGTTKNGSAIGTERTDPENALFEKDAEYVGGLYINFFSLGRDLVELVDRGGWIEVDFDAPIFNGPSNDLAGVEVTGGGSATSPGGYPLESAKVEFSYNGSWYLGIGELTNNANDLQRTTFVEMPAGIPYADSVRITDTTPWGPHSGGADGYDVDAVMASQLVTDMETAWGDGTGFGGKQWGMWFGYTVQAALVETILVPSDGSTVSSAALVDGSSYELRASGTYRFANWGEAGIADAQCSLRPPGVWYSFHSYSVDTWVPGDAMPLPYTSMLEVKVDGVPFAWQPTTCDTTDHLYTGSEDGAGSSVDFQIVDSSYGDNVDGDLQVEIWWTGTN